MQQCHSAGAYGLQGASSFLGGSNTTYQQGHLMKMSKVSLDQTLKWTEKGCLYSKQLDVVFLLL